MNVSQPRPQDEFNRVHPIVSPGWRWAALTGAADRESLRRMQGQTVKVAIVAGTRPEVVKLAPVRAALAASQSFTPIWFQPSSKPP